MIKFLLLTLLFISSLYANKVIYTNYDEVPQRVVKGEIFPITLKTLSTVREFDDINYEFFNYSGLKIITQYPDRVEKGKYFYDTFYLQSTQNWAKLPDINATLIASKEYNSTIVRGEKLNVIALNPRSNFSNVIANSFDLLEYKTTSFDAKHNIIIFVATATNSDLAAIKFKKVFKQGIESLTESHLESKVTYFLVVDKKLENFSFSYFNLLKNRFLNVNIPIVVIDDSVTTQTDLKPKDQSKERLKMSIAAVITLFGIIFILWRKKYIYLILILFPLIYIAYLAIPEQEICIKEGTQIRLLPVLNGTIFETTQKKGIFLKEGEIDGFVKIQLKNERIGWVKNEDICSY